MPGDRERVATPPPATIVRALLWCAALGRAPSRRDGRVAEGARLESVYTGNRIVGSNPTPSARAPAIGGATKVPAQVPRHWSSFFLWVTAVSTGARLALPRLTINRRGRRSDQRQDSTLIL